MKDGMYEDQLGQETIQNVRRSIGTTNNRKCPRTNWDKK